MVKAVLDFSKIESEQFLINPKYSPNLQEANDEIRILDTGIMLDAELFLVAGKIGREAEKGVTPLSYTLLTVTASGFL